MDDCRSGDGRGGSMSKLQAEKKYINQLALVLGLLHVEDAIESREHIYL